MRLLQSAGGRPRCRARRSAGAAQDKPPIKIGVLNDHVGPLCRPRRAGLGRWPPRWRSRISALRARAWKVEVDLRRPPEQARRRRQHRAPVVRRRQGRRDHRRAELRRRRWRSAKSPRRRTRLTSTSGAATSDLTGKACSPNTMHWAYDTWMLANGTGRRMVKAGGDTWFFITADYAFGHALERDTDRGRARPTAARSGQRRASVHHLGLLLVPAAGAGVARPRSSASPTPAATRSTRSSRRPSSASSAAARSWPACWCSSPTCMRSA